MKKLLILSLLFVSGCATTGSISRKEYNQLIISGECTNSLTKKHQWMEKFKEHPIYKYYCQHCLKEIERP